MGRIQLFTKEEITSAALELTRAKGSDAVTARALAAHLGSSSRPIFGLFKNMDEVHASVATAALPQYRAYVEREIASGVYSVYKAVGMAYIRFAREEKNLFYAMFVERDTLESLQGAKTPAAILKTVCTGTGLSREAVRRFHTEMWRVVHDIACSGTENYAGTSEETASELFDRAYTELITRYLHEESEEGEKP